MHDAERTIKRKFGHEICDQIDQTWAFRVVPRDFKERVVRQT